MQVICPRCGYTWRPRRTRRTSKYTCPNCGYTFYMYVTPPTPPTPTPPPSTTPTPTTTPPPTPSTARFRGEDIKVWVKNISWEAYNELKKVAEEVSSPDPSGVEVLILDADTAEKILRAYGAEAGDEF